MIILSHKCVCALLEQDYGALKWGRCDVVKEVLKAIGKPFMATFHVIPLLCNLMGARRFSPCASNEWVHGQ